jgi:hypothetical protein
LTDACVEDKIIQLASRTWRKTDQDQLMAKAGGFRIG